MTIKEKLSNYPFKDHSSVYFKVYEYRSAREWDRTLIDSGFDWRKFNADILCKEFRRIYIWTECHGRGYDTLHIECH